MFCILEYDDCNMNVIYKYISVIYRYYDRLEMIYRMKRIREVNRVEEKESRKENVMKMKVEMKKSENINMKNIYIDDVVKCFLNEKKRKIVVMRIDLINRIVNEKERSEEIKRIYKEIKNENEKFYSDYENCSIEERKKVYERIDKVRELSIKLYDEKRRLNRYIDKVMLNNGFDKRLVSMFVMYEKDNELMNVLSDEEIDDILNNKF